MYITRTDSRDSIDRCRLVAGRKAYAKLRPKPRYYGDQRFASVETTVSRRRQLAAASETWRNKAAGEVAAMGSVEVDVLMIRHDRRGFSKEL